MVLEQLVLGGEVVDFAGPVVTGPVVTGPVVALTFSVLPSESESDLSFVYRTARTITAPSKSIIRTAAITSVFLLLPLDL